MKHRVWLGLHRRIFLSAAVVLLSVVTVVQPAIAGAQSAAAAQPSVASACSWPPPPGHVSCFAMVRTGIKLIPEKAGRLRYFKTTTTEGAPVAGSATASAADLPPYTPADLQAAYNLTAASGDDGIGETVAVVDAYDDPNAEDDLAFYRSFYNLPPCTTGNGCFEKVNEYGQAAPLPPPDPTADITGGWELEESLDMDMVSAICPNCHILLVEASSTSEDDLINHAAKWAGTCTPEPNCTPPANYVSNSYGGPDTADLEVNDFNFQSPGVAYTASTGDHGYGVAFPAASLGAIAVGGTSLLPSSNVRGWSEIAWSNGGSGCAIDSLKPLWQTDTGCSEKTLADVSAVADPNTGLNIYDTYDEPGFLTVGGTSASSPIIASVYALAGPQASDGTDPAYALYAHSGDLNDIVTGTNSFSGCTPIYLCKAGLGYDGPTGLGTPNGIGAFVATPGYPQWP